MQRLRDELRYVLTAFAYFTRLPMPRLPCTPADLAACARHLPLVGWVVGALGAAVLSLAAQRLPMSVAVGLSMAATVLVTGAFHEDGLADCCDGFGGGYTRDDVLRIMRDSRIGAFGAIGLVLVLGLKWQLLSALPTAQAAWLSLGAHAVSRGAALSFLLSHPYARATGKAQALTKGFGPGALLWATVSALPALLWPDWRAGIAVAAVLLGLRLVLGRWFMRRLGGYTGDCLGMAQQLFELTMYLVMAAWTGF